MFVQLAFVILFLIIMRKKFNSKNADANLTTIGAGFDESSTETKKVPYIAYIVPIIPVAMNMLFKWDAIPSLVLSIIVAMIFTGNMKSYKGTVDFINMTVSKAISDISGLIIFMMALIMFSGAATLNAQHFEPLFNAILPHSHLILAVALGVLAPLALFRGPLHIWGAGAATAAVLTGTGLFNDAFLLPLLYVPTLMAVSTDITQSWNVWGLDYMKVKSKDFLKYGVPIMWIVSIINEVLVYMFFG